MKSGAGDEPHDDDTYSSSECPGTAEHRRGTPGENTERVADYAKEIAFLLVLSYFFELSSFHGITLASHLMQQLRACARSDRNFCIASPLILVER